MYEKVIKFIGKENGSTSIILAGVHGNEKCGIGAFERILPGLKIQKGTVFFCYGNPRAIEKNIRFYESNLNRLFREDNLLSENERRSYEYGRAQFLKKYLDQSDALLDVHASSNPHSKQFVICEKNASETVKYLPFDLVVNGFDDIEPGGTDYYMNRIGKIGICIECGNKEKPESIKKAIDSILDFLSARGHITNKLLKPNKQDCVQIYYLYITKTDNFNLNRKFSDFEEIKKNEIIGIDGKEKITTKKDSVILFAHDRKQIGEEAFLLGEKRNSLA